MWWSSWSINLVDVKLPHEIVAMCRAAGYRWGLLGEGPRLESSATLRTTLRRRTNRPRGAVGNIRGVGQTALSLRWGGAFPFFRWTLFVPLSSEAHGLHAFRCNIMQILQASDMGSRNLRLPDYSSHQRKQPLACIFLYPLFFSIWIVFQSINHILPKKGGAWQCVIQWVYTWKPDENWP